MLGTYSTYRVQLDVLRSVIGLHVGNPIALIRSNLRFLGLSQGCMLGTYSTYSGQLEVLRSVIGLHVGNLQHL